MVSKFKNIIILIFVVWSQ